MRTKTLLSGLGLALVMAVAALATAPADLQAQCSGCQQTGFSTWQCGGTGPWCDGGTGTLCFQCDAFYASVPSAVTPDGSLQAVPSVPGQDVASNALELSPGISVLRATCSAAITKRYYTAEAAEKARRATASLVFE